MSNNYILKYHDFYASRVNELKETVRHLKQTLTNDEFKQHEVVKLAARIRKASQTTIPTDPNRAEYKLRKELSKYRRYKQGLQRYRIIFCFASKPPIIVYLYLNNRKGLRKQGSKTDPYEEFKKMLKAGKFAHSPNDPKVKKWIKNHSLR
jgi:toxin YhaV